MDNVVLDRTALKAAMRRVANDPNFAKQLEAKPATALKSIGLALPVAVATELDKRPLSQTIEQVFGPPGTGTRSQAETYVEVGVSVGVHVVVEAAVHTVLESSPGGPGRQLSTRRSTSKLLWQRYR